MKINSTYNANVNITAKVSASNKKWELTDSLKEKITSLAKEDAEKNIYMGKKFLNLRKNEISKVAPNRGALMGQISRAFGSSEDMQKIEEADRRFLCMMFGKPYEAEVQSSGTGSAIHVYDENNDEILTYTNGVGWHHKESRLETEVHMTLKSAYYEAYHNARQEIKSQAFSGFLNIKA